MKQTSQTLAVLFIIATARLYAAEALTWTDCVNEAAAKNPDIAAAFQGTRSANALYQGSYRRSCRNLVQREAIPIRALA